MNAVQRFGCGYQKDVEIQQGDIPEWSVLPRKELEKITSSLWSGFYFFLESSERVEQFLWDFYRNAPEEIQSKFTPILNLSPHPGTDLGLAAFNASSNFCHALSILAKYQKVQK